MFLFIFSFLSLFAANSQPEIDDPTSAYRFQKGEQLEFKLNYGWFTVGKASLVIDDDYQLYDNKDCFKVDIKGETAGLLGVFTNVDDRWGGYVTKDDLIPLHAYRNIQEGKYVREERTYFKHDSGKVEVNRYDPRKKERKPTRVFDIPKGVNDLMSSYMYLRNLDFSPYQKGDTISVQTFYEDVLYDFKLVFDGKEMLDSEVGELSAYKLYFLIPVSDIFPDQNGVIAWVSADSSHLPLRIQAQMFFGTAYCDLTSYRNIKYGPDYE
ncbi:MAG: DUF3108 domain-containing protein [Cyclobacteriaceae bacterium]